MIARIYFKVGFQWVVQTLPGLFLGTEYILLAGFLTRSHIDKNQSSIRMLYPQYRDLD